MDAFAGSIPCGECCSVYHIASSSKQQPPTICHLVLVEIENILVAAIDVVVYSTPSATVLYISKVDSSGYAPYPITRSLVQLVLHRLLDLHAEPGVSTIIALFARAQPQYLFPKSSENPLKNTLDDQSLIRWWLRTLDPFVDSQNNLCPNIILPGFSQRETDTFLSRIDKKWQHGFVFEGSHTLANIPKFPDDPKTRFLDELERNGELSTIEMSTFWELMAGRQECASGRVVAFIGIRLGTLVKSLSPTKPLYIDEKVYKKAYDSLQYGDFSSREKARECSDSWLKGVKSMLGKEGENWIETIQGKKQSAVQSQDATILSVRKPVKRDVDNLIANDLCSFVRKKPKN